MSETTDKVSDDILYRFLWPVLGPHVSLCRHLQRELDEHLEEMIGIGAMVKLTKGRGHQRFHGSSHDDARGPDGGGTCSICGRVCSIEGPRYQSPASRQKLAQS
jgi:hypothetical protein